ncbi:MAG: T9SS C-terminal target domain-containing protein [Ignavibacteriae bacterium]|nr:MAG: T9SS C-terminal target domain-containing protein [Ignavibacteriota bacterium]
MMGRSYGFSRAALLMYQRRFFQYLSRKDFPHNQERSNEMSKKPYCFITILFTLIMSAHSYAQIDPGTKNLTHSWTFNDGTANDYIGGADGTLMGSAYITDGTLFTDYPHSWMEMPAGKIAVNTYKEITIEAWYQSVENANTGYSMLANFGDTKNAVGINYFFFTAARGDNNSRAAISCGVETSPWSGETGANGPEYDDGNLHHMVSTLDSTNITLYIDGKLQVSSPLLSSNRIANISPMYAYLAKSGYDGDSTWLGLILEFNIYNKVLSAGEILFLFNKGGTATKVEEKKIGIPNEFILSQNYPNPFNPATVIKYQLPVASHMSLKVFDLLGHEVATLFQGDRQPGTYEASFDGSRLPSGVYLCRLSSNNYCETKKLILLK